MKKPMLVIALASAFAAFAGAAPASLDAMLDSVKVSSASHGFASDLVYAQSEAVRRNSRVVLCKSADGQACSESGGWAQGWIMFHDANGDGVRGHGEDIILREQAFSKTLRFTGSLNAVRSVAFGPTGAARLVGMNAQAGTLTVCRHAAFPAEEARQVMLRAGWHPEVRRAVVTGCA
jgi:type IV fimbrial biogenesis protein FimT